MIGKMIQNLGNRMENIKEKFKKDLEEIRANKEMTETINEI